MKTLLTPPLVTELLLYLTYSYSRMRGCINSCILRSEWTDLRKNVSSITGQAFEQLDQRGEALQQLTVSDVQRAQLQK